MMTRRTMSSDTNLLWRLIGEAPARNGRPPDTPAPSLDGLTPAAAHWCRTLTYDEVKRCFPIHAARENLVRHVRSVTATFAASRRCTTAQPPGTPQSADGGRDQGHAGQGGSKG